MAVLVAVQIEAYAFRCDSLRVDTLDKSFIINICATSCNAVQTLKIPLLTEGL